MRRTAESQTLLHICLRSSSNISHAPLAVCGVAAVVTHHSSDAQRSPPGVRWAAPTQEQGGNGDHQILLNIHAQRSGEAFRGKIRRKCLRHGRRGRVGKETKEEAPVEVGWGGGGRATDSLGGTPAEVVAKMREVAA